MNESELREHLRSLSLDSTLPGDTVLRPEPLQTLQLPTTALERPAPEERVTASRDISLGSTIGEGGTALVREAYQTGLRRDVAAKTLREGHTASQRSSLLHEALVSGGLEHPNVAPIHTLGEAQDGAPVIIMKRVEGVAWSRCIADPSSAPGLEDAEPIDWHLDVLGQVCRAVHFAHSRGILHRDIKPDNVMVGRYGEVYLVDWGIAVALDASKGGYLRLAQDAKGVAGTPAYMSPEMVIGDGELLDERTDVFLLGACLCEVITGRPPHDGETLLDVMVRAYECPPFESQGSAELVAICRKAMAKEPEARFSSAEELRQALTRYRTHRASESLTNQAVERLEELEAAIGARRDDNRTRTLAGEVRFGLRQALETWPENQPALAAQHQWLCRMVELEVASDHLAAADALLDEFDERPRHLVELLAYARERAAERATEIAALEGLRDEFDHAVGARFRWLAAVFAVFFWTAIPLIGGVVTEWGDAPLSPARFVGQSVIVIVFVAVVVSVMKRRGYSNERNRVIARIVMATVVLVPLYRVMTVLGGIPTPVGLAIEQVLYGLMFGGLGIASGRTGLLPVFICAAAGVTAVLMPSMVYAALAASNFVLLSWLAWIWRGQEAS